MIVFLSASEAESLNAYWERRGWERMWTRQVTCRDYGDLNALVDLLREAAKGERDD